MNKKEINFSESQGKTIKGVAYSYYCSQAVVVFTDGTFSTIGIYHSYEDMELFDDKLNLFEFGDDQLDGVGLITLSDMELKREERHHKLHLQYQQEELIEEKNTYARLKKKFES